MVRWRLLIILSRGGGGRLSRGLDLSMTCRSIS